MLKIRTNHKGRNFKYGYELAPKWRKEFDYMEDEEFETCNFIWYRKCATPLNDFKRIVESEFKGWDGYTSDTFFSGLVIKLSDDGEQYKIGMYFS
jgi:hypothetical protein